MFWPSQLQSLREGQHLEPLPLHLQQLPHGKQPLMETVTIIEYAMCPVTENRKMAQSPHHNRLEAHHSDMMLEPLDITHISTDFKQRSENTVRIQGEVLACYL